MPLIIGSGLGRDDQLIIQRIIAAELVCTVRVEQYLVGYVQVADDPVATVEEAPTYITGTVTVEQRLWGTVNTEQRLVGVVKCGS